MYAAAQPQLTLPDRTRSSGRVVTAGLENEYLVWTWHARAEKCGPSAWSAGGRVD
jgi:hypothetical protein